MDYYIEHLLKTEGTKRSFNLNFVRFSVLKARALFEALRRAKIYVRNDLVTCKYCPVSLISEAI